MNTENTRVFHQQDGNLKEEASVKESVKTSDKADGKKEKGKDKGITLRDFELDSCCTIESHSGMKKCLFYCHGASQFLKTCINNYSS